MWQLDAIAHLKSKPDAIVFIRALTCRNADIARKDFMHVAERVLQKRLDRSTVRIWCSTGNHDERELRGFGDRMLMVTV